MANQLDRFQTGALKAADVKVVLPPDFGFEDGDRLIRQEAARVLDNLSDDGDPLGQLQQREDNLEQSLTEKEARRKNELAEIEDRLRRHIRGQFPDATKEEQRKLYWFVLRDGEKYMEFLERTDDWADDLVTDKSAPAMEGRDRDPRSYPSLWKESDDPDLWRKFAGEYRQAKRVGSYVAFRLSVVRLLKRRAEVGAMPTDNDPEPGNPFKGTSVAYDYCTRIVTSYHKRIKSPKPMEQMGHLHRALGGDSKKVVKAGKRTIERAGLAYEDGNVLDFVTTIQEILEHYDSER